MTNTMRAAVITRFGGPEVLEIQNVEAPRPGAEQVLVRVHATALNRADLLQRQGRYPAPAGSSQEIPGIEFAGEVVKLGPGASGWRVGDRVFGIAGGGAYAEELVVHERALAAIPAQLSWTDAAAVPEAFITAHDALVTQADAKPSESVLVHAAGSGVGLAAIQIARAVGAIPYGTARTAEKLERAKQLGLEAGVVAEGDLANVVHRCQTWTKDAGMNVILDLVGGDYVAVNVKVAALKGRIMCIGTVAGGNTTLPVSMLLGKRLTMRGTVLRARPLEEKIAATRAFAAQLVPLLANGSLKPVVDRVFSLEEVGDAHRHLESNAAFGKVVIEIAANSR